MAATKSVDIPSGTAKVTVSDLRQNKSAIVSRYSRIPEPAEAIQFQGWDNAPLIIGWMPGTYFVPAGYPHKLRYAEEYLDGTGKEQTLGHNVPEFLVYHNSDGNDYRIDLGSYLIRTQPGALYFYDAKTFKELYQEAIL